MKQQWFVFSFLFLMVSCLGRGTTVQETQQGDLSKIQGTDFTKVYFKPFDLNTVELKGDHGAGAEIDGNRKNGSRMSW